MSKEVIEALRKQAAEIAREGHMGWGNTMVAAAEALEALLAERDAILLQAQGWACEAKTQRATVDTVGNILGGIPDWGPIAAGVEALKKDAERYRQMRAVVIAERDGCTEELYDNECDRLCTAYVVALQGDQP